jgi:hypothetical protein
MWCGDMNVVWFNCVNYGGACWKERRDPSWQSRSSVLLLLVPFRNSCPPDMVNLGATNSKRRFEFPYFDFSDEAAASKQAK